MTHSQKGYVIGPLKFKDLDKVGEFVEKFASGEADFFSKYCGKILVRTVDPHFLEGRRYDLHVIVEFGAFPVAQKMLNSLVFRHCRNTDAPQLISKKVLSCCFVVAIS